MTSTYAAEQAAIMEHIDANWREDDALITPVAWPNQEYKPGDATTAYIEPFVNRQEAFNADLGPTKTIRHPGLLSVNVRVLVHKGDDNALTLADQMGALFRNQNIEGLQFRAYTVRDIGAEGPWYRVQVDCPYWRDSIH